MQRAIVRWADDNDVFLVHPGAGAAYLNSAATAAKMKAMGLKPGTADLLVLEPGVNGAHCLELKVPGKTLTTAQTEWHARATAKGLRCGVAHSLEEFVSLVNEHRGLPDFELCLRPLCAMSGLSCISQKVVHVKTFNRTHRLLDARRGCKR